MYLHLINRDDYLSKEFLNDSREWIYDWEKCDEGKTDQRSIGNFKKINLFVGANNSGKSRFLRGILKSNDSYVKISYDVDSLEDKDQDTKILYTKVHSEVNHRRQGNISKIETTIRKNNPYFELTANYRSIENTFSIVRRDIKETKQVIKTNKTPPLTAEYNKILKYLESVKKLGEEALFIKNNKPKGKKYIPILRSIHANQHLSEEIFKGTIKDNYGIDKNIYTGLELFKLISELKNSTIPNRKKIKKFEKFLSKHFFRNEEVELTTDIKTKQILFSINELEYPIHDIGDGIQSLIILLLPIFIADKNDWFFIEEPETNLHPGLQRIFIETLLYDEYLISKNLRYFYTTHSNHFLDVTLLNNDISIFQFEKTDKTKFLIKTDVKPNKDILDILGVNTSSVFLANTSIWVEGPTDRKYLSKLLKLISQNKNEQYLKEDIDFAFFEYGGNLIEHYLFDDTNEINEEEIRDKINSFALSNKIYLLADNDNADGRSAKHKRRVSLEKISSKQDNFTYQNTILKEIENLLPVKILKEFMKGLVKGVESQNKVKEIDFKRKDYFELGLGEFFEKQLTEVKIPKKNFKSFKADSGTLMNDYKIKLANFVINSNYKYSDFIQDNDELKNIIERLYEFIKK